MPQTPDRTLSHSLSPKVTIAPPTSRSSVWLDHTQVFWDRYDALPVEAEASRAALRALVSEAVHEAVRDELAAFHGNDRGWHRQARAEGAERPAQKPQAAGAPIDRRSEPAIAPEQPPSVSQIPVTSALSTPSSQGAQVTAVSSGGSSPRGQRNKNRIPTKDTNESSTWAESNRRRGRIPRVLRRMFTWSSASPRLNDSIEELDQQERAVLQGGIFSLAGLKTQSCAEKVTACLIFLNAVTIGFQSDMTLRGHLELARQLQYLNWGLVFVFVIELCARVGYNKREFFNCHGPTIAWNMFDLFTVTSSALDVMLQLISSDVKIDQVSYLRIIRILRVLKAFRIIRILPFFRELRVMVGGVLNCSKSILWAIALMVLVSYMFATMAGQACSGDALWLDDEVECQFSSMVEIMFLLFQATTGGMDWGELAEELLEFSQFLVAGLCLYILVVLLVIVNVITAVFVQAALEQNQDPEELLVDTIQRRRKWLRDVQVFFERCDQDASGAMSVEELVHVLNQNDARSSLRTLGIDAELIDVSTLHGILDTDGDGRVTLEEFAHCLQGLRGHARSSDMMVLRSDIKKLLRDGKKADGAGPSM